MNSFKTDLIVTPLQDGRRWKLHEGFTYWRTRDRIVIKIQVPAGFITDFASVPRVFRSIIPAWGRYGKAAVIHDYLYQETGIHHWMTRKLADELFLGAMLVSGTKPWKAKVMYRAVRLFGRFAWRA